MSEVIGKIYRIDETKTFGEKGFRKRECIVITNDQYQQHILLEFLQDKCDLLDNFKVDDGVKVSINLNGRLWTNPEGKEVCFNSLVGWRIENTEVTQEQKLETTTDINDNEPSDLPF